MFVAMKQHGFGGRAGGGGPGRLFTGALLAGWLSACATAPGRVNEGPPGPSAAELADAEAALQATQKDRGQDHAIDTHLEQAERALADAKDRAARGDSRQARLLFARAQADIELGQALGRRERALAEAEVLERQLVETRATPPAASPTPEVTP
jgi:hypothetical protein